MILVTGAAGKTGQAVIQALFARRVQIKALVYRPEQIETAQTLGADQVVVGDMADPTTWSQIGSEIMTVYHICPNMSPAELEIGRLALQAAQRAKVDHFVYHSVLHPQTETMPHHWRKLQVEALIFKSGLPFTILQPAAYMQNILGQWPSIVEEGLYRVPYPLETRLSLIDVADVAAVAATVLTEPGHAGAIYELAGPDPLTQVEVAAILSRALGQSVRAEQIPLDEWQAQAGAAGLAEEQISMLLKMFRYYEQFGFVGNPNVLSWLLGRAPTGFETFAAGVSD